MRLGRPALRAPLGPLALLVAAHWLAVLVFALTVRHNGWLYYQGGDQIWHATTGWLLGHGELPPTQVGYIWPVVLAPLMLLAGGDYLAALPWLVLFNVLVLAPVAIACIYGLATRIGGERFGYLASGVWVVGPFAAIPLFVERYHDRFVEQFLPQALGLTAMPDYPSMICLLVAAFFVARSLDAGSGEAALRPAAAAGLAAGVAIGLKPSNALFLVGAGLAYLIATRWVEAIRFVLALTPSLIVLLLWKQRGLGELPVALAGEQLASGGQLVAAAGLDRYVDLDWANFRQNMADLREYFWSVRLLQWAPFAGLLAVAVRSRPLAGLLAGWFGAFLLVKGTTPLSTVSSGSFFRFLLPAAPAYMLLVASIPLLVPGLGRRLGAVARATPSRARPALLAAAAATGIFLPLAWLALADPIASADRGVISNGILVRVDDGLAPEILLEGSQARLTWRTEQYGEETFYRVLRAPVGADTVCVETGGAIDCTLEMESIGATREPQFVDPDSGDGYTYRIGVAANWRDDPEGGDVFIVSPPVTPS